MNMKKLGLLIALLTVISACDNKSNGSIERVYFEGSELSPPEGDVGMYVDWEKGEKTAFRFVFNHPDNKNIQDDELSEIFWIEVPSDVSSFEIKTGDDLTQTDFEIYYVRACFCGWKAFNFNKYDVSGEKLSPNQWRISFDIKAESQEQEFELKDSGVYILTTLEN